MTVSSPSLRRILLAAAALLAGVCGARARTGEALRVFHVPAGDAAITLQRFCDQSGVQLVIPIERVRGVRTHAVDGDFTAQAALDRMIAGTELHVVQDAASGALGVVRIPRPMPSRIPPVAPVPRFAPPRPSPFDAVVQLDPFEVRTDPDHSYAGLDANSITSFRLALDEAPATAQVFTRTFMDDVEATSVQDMLVNYSGTVAADPNNAGAALQMPGDRDGSGGGLGIRGLAVGPPKRDGFDGTHSLFRSALGLIDAYSVDRVEVIEGPQSLLYGAVGGGGVVNLVSKRARFGASAVTVQTQLDQYGGKRATVDANAGGSRVAVRLAAVSDAQRNFRYNLGGELYGVYGTAAVKLGPKATLRIQGERDSSWQNVAYTPTAADLRAFLPASDARRGEDVRYLALTGQLADLRGSLWNGPVDYQHISSFGAWWSSERIDEKFASATLDAALGHGFSLQAGGVYSETLDDRFTVGKNLVPAAGLPGSGDNPFPGTAVRFSPGDNWQSDRTRAFRATLLHEMDFHIGHWTAHARTAIGVQASHQGPSFASNGIDRRYYLADANGNAVVDPALALDYGRIPLGSLYFPIQDGIPLEPVFRPGATRVSIGGQTYVLQPRIRQDPSLVTAANPAGLVPNNPGVGTGYAGAWNRGPETHDRRWNVANVTDWADGRLTTLVGVSVDRFTTLNVGPGAAPTYVPPHNDPGYTAGANLRIDSLPGLRVFATISTAGLSAGSTKDPDGRPLAVPRARTTWPEFGLKYAAPDHRWAASLSLNPATHVANEARSIGGSFFNALNPAGINGRYNSGDQWINVDRVARSAELVVTATPTPHWRIRLAATAIDGELTKSVTYGQLYNDQFYARDGLVTYRDGTPVMVAPAAAGGPSTTPLSLAMINDPQGAYSAMPDPNSGRITNPTLIAALTAVDPVHGTAATGVTGLPLSSIQYNFADPYGGAITVVHAGDKTTGINTVSFNAETAYAFADGWLRGVELFGSVRTHWGNRAYYTSYFGGDPTSTLGASRVLYGLPSSTVVGLGIGYEHRFRHVTWRTRLNLDNALNHYRVWIVPSPTNGAVLNARLSEQPRRVVWSVSLGF
ncbi:MAG TPA: TonB-dependent receptor plug domain-containing protein [Opitutaceae bacterium]|nr:TonB-dependent receptor plug domain-containing protein [Opitutaceae bacterium]